MVNSKYEEEPTEGRKVGGGQIFHEMLNSTIAERLAHSTKHMTYAHGINLDS